MKNTNLALLSAVVDAIIVSIAVAISYLFIEMIKVMILNALTPYGVCAIILFILMIEGAVIAFQGTPQEKTEGSSSKRGETSVIEPEVVTEVPELAKAKEMMEELIDAEIVSESGVGDGTHRK